MRGFSSWPLKITCVIISLVISFNFFIPTHATTYNPTISLDDFIDIEDLISMQNNTENDLNQPDFELYAKGAVLMDAESGRVLYGKNADEVLANASTTKILTCIVALENGDLSGYGEVSAYAAGMPKVKLNMKAGEYYRLEDMLYSLMLESHNDTAVAIAEFVAGSVEEFAVMMNRKAKDIGCNDSFFITPSGLDADTKDGSRFHSTTARDLALIMSYCLTESPKKDEFLKITRTPDYNFSNYKKVDDNFTHGGRNFSINNHNAFLNMMDGAYSGKTGFTSRAGYCYVGALKRDERTYVVALLACGWPNHKTYKWSDTRELMEYGINNYFYRDVFEIPEIDEIPVIDGIADSGRPNDMAFSGLKVVVHNDELEKRLLRNDEKITSEIELPQSISAPVSIGEEVGKVKYYLSGDIIKELPIITDDIVKKINYRFIFHYVLDLFCV